MFFVPMVVTIGQRKLDKAPWGLVFKVGLGAVLGVLDVATDIYAIINFTLQRKFGFAKAVLAMVSVSMAIQLATVWMQGRKRGARHVSKEALIVITGFKPAIDAFRVISGAKGHVGDTIDIMFEVVLSKVTEM